MSGTAKNDFLLDFVFSYLALGAVLSSSHPSLYDILSLVCGRGSAESRVKQWRKLKKIQTANARQRVSPLL